MKGQRVLVVDDEVHFRSALVRILKALDFEVMESATGATAIQDCRNFNPDVVLLDLMLPDFDGLTVCREMRRYSDAAIVVLSVISEEETKVRALDDGADDYLTKPFGSDELLARIRAVTRRAGLTSSEGQPRSFGTGALFVDLSDHTVVLDGVPVHLSPTEFNLLEFFASNAGRILRHEAILGAVWGEEYVGDVQVLRTYVAQLRSRLRDDPTNPRFVITEPGLGYRFVPVDS